MSSLQFPLALWRHRQLAWRLIRRDVAGRYKGSALGWGWSLIQPLLVLGVYTFVFSTVFRSRWGDLQELGSLGFAINLFAGLIVFNLFAECANRGPALILHNPSYVTKVMFPLEILALVSVGTALFHAAMGLAVLAAFQVAAHTGGLGWTWLWLPLVWFPLASGCLAMGWLLSALGVFLRDLQHVVGVGVNLLLFLSAVFYPVSALPERWQPWLQLNPLVPWIEQTRRVLVGGQAPNWSLVLSGSLLGLLVCELSYRGFQRARRGFADVL
jgi:lipopolysaccharide transport system permease protein